MNIFEMIEQLVAREGSDLHLVPGKPPTFRLDGSLVPVDEAPVLTPESAKELIIPLLTQEQKDYFTVNKEIDFGYQYKNQGRFRINVYRTLGSWAAALRLIPARIKTIDELQLPSIFHHFGSYRQGLVLLTGPTGEGKSTSLAAIIDEINAARAEHIITVEDPVEFVHQPKKSIISQREINSDTHGWDIALRSALREDPDVVLVGEMRDFETIAATITIAETGHLVFATLHTQTAAQTIDRIIDVFPSHQQGQVRQQLAGAIKVVAAQRLVPRQGGGRVVATEVMVANSAIRNLIREQKTYQIDSAIQTSAESGMMLIESHLAQLVQRGAITPDDARRYAFRREEIERLLGG